MKSHLIFDKKKIVNFKLPPTCAIYELKNVLDQTKLYFECKHTSTSVISLVP